MRQVGTGSRSITPDIGKCSSVDSNIFEHAAHGEFARRVHEESRSVITGAHTQLTSVEMIGGIELIKRVKKSWRIWIDVGTVCGEEEILLEIHVAESSQQIDADIIRIDEIMQQINVRSLESTLQ